MCYKQRFYKLQMKSVNKFFDIHFERKTRLDGLLKKLQSFLSFEGKFFIKSFFLHYSRTRRL